MIKGINRQIIEVRDTGSVYYEKAWLVVREEYARTESSVLEDQAVKLVSSMDTPSAVKMKRRPGLNVLRMALSAFAGCGITLLLQTIVG